MILESTGLPMSEVYGALNRYKYINSLCNLLYVTACCASGTDYDQILVDDLCLGSGTGSEQPRCPVGTFSNMTRLESADQCTSCTEGFYCETPGLTEPTGPCAEGTIWPLKLIHTLHGFNAFCYPCYELKSLMLAN